MQRVFRSAYEKKPDEEQQAEPDLEQKIEIGAEGGGAAEEAVGEHGTDYTSVPCLSDANRGT